MRKKGVDGRMQINMDSDDNDSKYVMNTQD